ncbi:citron-like protein [Mycena galopus ATCC 62051]|nr:citron-like protein [Mycena galopus ATCC 62051]
MEVFATVALSSEGFSQANKINCAALYNSGQRIVYGTDDGVYLQDFDIGEDPQKVLALVDVNQVDVLEDFQVLVLRSDRQVLTFPLAALDQVDPSAGLQHATQISATTSFFKVGFCLGRVLVSTFMFSKPSTVIKVMEAKQGWRGTLKPMREFFVPTQVTSAHYLKTRMCVGTAVGFEILDLESLDTNALLDPSDKSLEFVVKKQKPVLPFLPFTRIPPCPTAIYRAGVDFLLCYDKFAFYIDKSGGRAREEFMVTWEGKPTGFAMHWPYVLAFSPSFVEIRHTETGLVSQKMPGSNIRLLFSNMPPSVNCAGGSGGNGIPCSDDILMVSEDRILAVRLA